MNLKDVYLMKKCLSTQKISSPLGKYVLEYSSDETERISNLTDGFGAQVNKKVIHKTVNKFAIKLNWTQKESII